jgi:Zn-dependent protease
LGFVVAIFFCVYLHELGHAMTAKRYGIRTLDISMLPIGGLARLERMPKSPIAEFWIAIAGPAVNVVIALVLTSMLGLQAVVKNIENLDLMNDSILSQLVMINIGLAVFNMIPALPMDGGRILRSLLQLRMSRLKATEISAKVSRYLAGILIIAGLMYGFHLVLIGIFVLIAGFQELMMVRIEHLREQGLQPGNGSMYQEVPMPGFQSWPPESFGGRQPRSPVGPVGDDDVLDATEVRRIP